MNDRHEWPSPPPAAPRAPAPTAIPSTGTAPHGFPEGTVEPAERPSRSGAAKALAVSAGVAAVALLGVVAYLFVSNGDDAADPAPVATTEPVAEKPATSEVVAVAQGSDLTEDQKLAAKEARDRLAVRAMSRDGLVEFLVNDGTEYYSEEVAEIAVDSLGVDWDFQARRSAEGSIEYSARSKAGMTYTLLTRLFTEEQTSRAIDAIDVDWSVQPERFAREYSDSNPVSRSHLVDAMTEENDPAFTEAEAEQGITDADIDFNKEAAEAAETHLEEDPDLSCDDLTRLLVGEWGDGFSLDEANYATETSGTC